MIAVDTNVLVRCVAADDPDQARAAADLLRLPGGVYVPRTVTLECEWVLRSAYGMDSAAIASAMRGLFGLPGIEVESAVAVAEAIGHMEAGLDFADALHRSTTPEERAVYTFDQTFVRRARELGLDVRVVPRMPVEDPPRARGVEPEK